MLVLTRKVDETIVCETTDGPIRITVCRHDRDGRVRLGVTAPQQVQIYREELRDDDRRAG